MEFQDHIEIDDIFDSCVHFVKYNSPQHYSFLYPEYPQSKRLSDNFKGHLQPRRLCKKKYLELTFKKKKK